MLAVTGQTYPIDMPIEQLDELLAPAFRPRCTADHHYRTGIAFSRSGTDEYPGCVVVMSNGDDGEKTINLGENYGNKTWRDFLGNRQESVVTDQNGEATFFCNGGSVSVWVIEEVIYFIPGGKPGDFITAVASVTALYPARLHPARRAIDTLHRHTIVLMVLPSRSTSYSSRFTVTLVRSSDINVNLPGTAITRCH